MMSSAEYALQLPGGGGPIPISFLDEAAADQVRSLLEQSESVQVRLTQADEADTMGHVLAAGSIFVSATFGDDVEGHALSLRFPNQAAAAEFQKRLLASGLIAATLVTGAIGAGIMAQAGADQAASPGPAIEAAAAPRDPSIYYSAASAQSGVEGPEVVREPSVYYSAASAQSGVEGPEMVREPSVYYSASSAESGVQGPEAAREAEIYYSASSAQSGVQGPEAAREAEIYYSASSAQSGVQGPEAAREPSVYYSAASALSGVPGDAEADEAADEAPATHPSREAGPDKELPGV
jgi:hypothetical protein